MNASATTVLPNVGMLLLAGATFAWHLADAVTGARAQIREWRRRGDERAEADAFESCGIYRHIGSPPSHAAGKA